MYHDIKKYIILITVATASLLTGCTTVRPPAENVEQRLGYTSELFMKYKIDEAWWGIYNDHQLEFLLAKALENNADYARTAININKALYQANLLGADLLPTFSAQGGASANKNTKSGEPSVRTFSGELAVSYEVDLWRRLADTASAQEWEYKASMEDREAARFALINNVIDAYFSLAYLDAAITATRQSIENYEKIFQLIKIKYDSGKVSGLEPEQAAQSMLAAQNDLINLEVQQKLNMQTLRLLLNIPPDVLLTISYPDLLSLSTPEVDMDIPLAVLANRPDLKAAEYRLQGALKDTQAAQKEWYPTITLGAALNVSSNNADTVFNVPFAMGTVAINLPFLQWNRIKWNIKISEADYDKIKIYFEENINIALNEVDTALFHYKKAVALLENAKQKHKHDIKISEYYKARYESGADELSDWLDAMNTALSSQLASVQSKYQVIKYENMLYKAMAGRYTVLQ